MIHYSLTKGAFTRKELNVTGKLAEDFFQTAKDSSQMPEKELTFKLLTQKFPLSVNIIYDDKKVIGYTFALPCDKETMHAFVKGKITEKELFYAIRDKISPEEYCCIYLVDSLIISTYRRKGLAIKARVMQIKKYQSALRKKDLILFSWPFTKEGKAFGRKLAKIMGLKILFKPHKP